MSFLQSDLHQTAAEKAGSSSPAPAPSCPIIQSVFVSLTCAFRYGREDLDVLGLTFRKDLFVANIQVFPPPTLEEEGEEKKTSLTRLQERLVKKLGCHAHPFTFQVASLACPTSVTVS